MKRWEKPVIQELKLCNTMQYDIETHDFLDGLCYCNQEPKNWYYPWGLPRYGCGHTHKPYIGGGKCPKRRVSDPTNIDILPSTCS